MTTALMALSPPSNLSIKAAYPLPLPRTCQNIKISEEGKKKYIRTSSAMDTRLKTTLLAFLLLLTFFVSTDMAEGFSNNIKHVYSLHKDGGVQVNSRKLLGHNDVLDYDYTGPNPKHDPRKGKPGRNP